MTVLLLTGTSRLDNVVRIILPVHGVYRLSLIVFFI